MVFSGLGEVAGGLGHGGAGGRGTATTVGSRGREGSVYGPENPRYLCRVFGKDAS